VESTDSTQRSKSNINRYQHENSDVLVGDSSEDGEWGEIGTPPMEGCLSLFEFEVFYHYEMSKI